MGKRKNKTKRPTAAAVRARQIQELEYAENRGYKHGLEDGIKQERDRREAESLKVRLELGRSYAAVFEGITRSALMFFDTGGNVLR
jgi:hypothetical protein